MTGKAYAAGLGSQDRRMVILITMQKLASSSVAAVRRALARRLVRLRQAETRLEESREDLARLQELAAEDDPANQDEISRLEERVAELLRGVDLNPDEIPALEELLAAANDVTDETKIERILTVVDESFADKSVLFFTEYKATQALLMSALHKRYGDGCVTFINGDGFIVDVQDSTGNVSNRTEDRHRAAARFNRPPEEWKDDFSIAVVDRYDLLFAREPRPKDGEDVAGVGLRVVDRAVRDAAELTGAFGAIRGLDPPLFVFRVRDRITGSDGPVRAVIVAAQSGGDGAWILVRDWELMQRLNPLADKPRSLVFVRAYPAYDVVDLMADAWQYVDSQLDTLDLPFALPAVESLACLVPGEAETHGARQTG